MTDQPPPTDELAVLRAQLAEALGEMQEVTDALQEQSAAFLAEVDAERARLRAERTRAEEEYGETARAGSAGEARQELQRRLDDEETSWREVLSGRDDHWSAREVRRELVADARREVDEVELTDPDLVRRYRAHAVLRGDDEVGEWR